MAKGKVKTVVADKGFGFIIPENAAAGDKDIFFHRSALTGGLRFENLNRGDEVEFELAEAEESKKGPSAKNVRPASDESESDESEMQEAA